ncbi:hypothetical protein HPP92_023375 [Vanilla planifolia]|uniref:SBP-type domain-containing protein n=1 Tax=Vanilla planifolia TaxID=51239 RepID=A0A835PSN8_VANPL|nr:hypothetical protein HPP92_023375 [Vanilla planifolia]
MEWDLKTPPWDLPELEQNAEEFNLSSVVSSRGGRAERQPAVGLPDCSVDLKLGGLGDFGLVDKLEEQRKASGILMAPVPPQPAAAGSLKRPRTAAAGNQNISCLVDGCKSDLSNCREYHRRHKVCEAHSKTPVVLVAGQEQRFCQQCSRFHLLVEFDEVKRSCRKRLDGHNRRRRKPQPELINSGNLFANCYGARLTSYHKILPTTATDGNWSGVMKTEEDAFYGHHSAAMHFMNRLQQPLLHHSSFFNRSLKEGKQFPFLHEGEGMSIGSRTALEPAAVCQPLLKTISSAAESSGNKILFSDGLPPVLDSDCALSLCHRPPRPRASI